MQRRVEPGGVHVQRLRVDRDVGGARAHPADDDPRRADQLRHLDDGGPGQGGARAAAAAGRRRRGVRRVRPPRRRDRPAPRSRRWPCLRPASATRGSNFSSANGTTSVTAAGACADGLAPAEQDARRPAAAGRPAIRRRSAECSRIGAAARKSTVEAARGPRRSPGTPRSRTARRAPHSSRCRSMAPRRSRCTSATATGRAGCRTPSRSISTSPRPRRADIRARAGSKAARTSRRPRPSA